MTIPVSGFFDGNGNTVREGNKVIYLCAGSPHNMKHGILSLVTQDGDAEVVFEGDTGTTPIKWNHLYLYRTAMHKMFDSIEESKERETLQLDVGSYEFALYHIKQGQLWRRMAWKPGKWIRLINERKDFRLNLDHTFMAYLALQYDDGRIMPWTPTQCDQLENDWQEVGI